MIGVLKVLPVNSGLSDVGLANQRISPSPVAVNLADVPEQTEALEAVGADGCGFTLTVTAVRTLIQSFEALST